MLDGLQEGLQEGLKRDLAMKHMINRLESFKEWPFQSDCNCTPLSVRCTSLSCLILCCRAAI